MLKNYGYHPEPNFGQRQQHLALMLVLLNLLAFLFHTVLDVCDEQYRRVRANSPPARPSSRLCKP